MQVLEIVEQPSPDVLKDIAGTFYMPTEVVITKPQICTPMMGRYYRTQQWLYNGEVVDNEILEAQGIEYTGGGISIFLVENWESWQDDGRTWYDLVGWALIAWDNESKKMPKYKKIARAINEFKNES